MNQVYLVLKGQTGGIGMVFQGSEIPKELQSQEEIENYVRDRYGDDPRVMSAVVVEHKFNVSLRDQLAAFDYDPAEFFPAIPIGQEGPFGGVD